MASGSAITRRIKRDVSHVSYELIPDLGAAIEAFVAHYIYSCDHMALSNVTAADVVNGSGKQLHQRMKEVQLRTIDSGRHYNWDGSKELSVGSSYQ